MVKSNEGFKYILLITDGMSKFVELCPLRDITAKGVVKHIYTCMLCLGINDTLGWLVNIRSIYMCMPK